ncbi:hypothetical protein F511_11760 [Dorcoceras hygrometricum]|uniref:Uncharacterized protein n=1 Tax=Dorcoceras hygrometricum TaxID=472368 RepID=A0A2Z7CDN1_9LAMI|nr:hypothetical protein F511_11760 [Dorcoceras hygrometricum]
MSSPSTTPVSSTAASIDSVPVSPETKEPWLPDQAELGSSQPPWYEEKSSNLRSSDISFIKEKGGMSDRFEVVIPNPNERAHRPPRGFHSFYINQLEMGLRFPLPRFIADLCQHIKISPSQLAPNSYSFLLSLAILLRYHNLPLVPYVSSPMRGKGPERVLPFDFSKDSLVDSPTGVVSTRLMCNMVSDRDLPVMKGAEDSEVVGHLAVNLASAMAWGGEIIRRLTRAHRTGKTNRKKFDEAMGRHAEMVARLEELEVLRAQDEVVAATQRKELEAELAAEKEARAAGKQALRAELERAHARAERVKEDFLKSPEFDSLLAKKAWGYFKDGFWGCLAQFRSNGYSEEEHPASFLDLQQALEHLGDDEDAEEEEQEEGEVGDGTEVNAPNSPKP